MTIPPSERNAWKRLRKNKTAVAGMIVIILCLVMAAFAYFISPDSSPNANRMTVEIGGRKPGFTATFLKVQQPGNIHRSGFFERLLFGAAETHDYIPITSYEWRSDSVIVNRFIDEDVSERQAYRRSLFSNDTASHIVKRKFYLGTDKFGRDILSRLIVGVRVSLAVGLVTVIISVVIGVLLGSLSGYFGGAVDDIIMWLINVVWSIPTLLLVFALTLLLGKGFWQVFIAIGLTTWVNVARLVRGQVMSIKQLDYVEAGRALGFSSSRIIVRHILPNVAGPIIVIAASNFASAIVIEAGLSFLGVGVQPPQPSWGLMI